MSDVRFDHRLQLRGAGWGVGEAPGKAILLGEHFVVHGAPALAVPVGGRRVRVSIAPGRGAWRVAPEATLHVRAMVSALGLDPDGVDLSVESDLPIGSGLGSSAALAVALVRAAGVTDVEAVRAHAHALEHLAHGSPSGVDDAVVSHGCPIWFEAGVLTPLPTPHRLPLWVAVTPSGPPTREAVAAVSRWKDAHPADFAELLAEAHRDAHVARDAVRDGDWGALGAAMNRAHVRLAILGVSTPAIEEVCRSARAAGALGAKLTGAGLGGAVLVLTSKALDLGGGLGQGACTECFPA